MNNLLVYSPGGWQPGCGGTIMLHKLCAELRRRGLAAAVAAPRTDGTDPYGNPHIDSRGLAQADATAIYPEVVNGNPFGAQRVVRWLLNPPGFFGGGTPTAFDAREMLVSYAPLFASHAPNAPRLEAEPLFFFDPFPEHIHGQTGTRRASGCYTVRKGIGKARLPEIDLRNAELTRADVAPAQFGPRMRRAKVFYSYDCATFLSIQAVLCGALSYVVPDPGVSAEAWRARCPLLRYGVNYGLEDREGTETRGLVAANLQQLQEEGQRTVDRLAEQLRT